MALEMLIGVNVVDDAAYQSYRDEMGPILASCGGGFGYDFRVSEVIKSPTPEPINRVFTIYFADNDAKDAFFANEEYKAIKQRHFTAAVSDSTIIATYETDD